MINKYFEAVKKNVRKEQILVVLYAVIVFAGLAKTYKTLELAHKSAFSMPLANKCIMLDAGHGGWDPGKIGDGNVLEKDINLSISQKLQAHLEQGGAFVVTTRTSDTALSERKRQDLNKRSELTNSLKVDIMISIHQNSFTNDSAKGAQVFYYNNSENSKLLAECIQAKMVSFLDDNNKRVAKSNENYYMLKKTAVPAVIVECGFLSNSEEKMKLTEEQYQENVAWSIYLGIIDYYVEKSK